MAHAGRNTGGSQFFICHSRNNTSHLDRNHTCFGKVVEGLEVIDAIEGLGYAKGFCVGSIIKYVTRYEHKNGVEDLKKAKWYIDYLIKMEEK